MNSNINNTSGSVIGTAPLNAGFLDSISMEAQKE